MVVINVKLLLWKDLQNKDIQIQLDGREINFRRTLGEKSLCNWAPHLALGFLATRAIKGNRKVYIIIVIIISNK